MAKIDLETLTVKDAALQITRKELSPVELTALYLERISKLNPLLNAYVTVAEEGALADARTAEQEIQRGKYRGPLHGIPFSIKDNLTTKGLRTTAGSKILSDWVPDEDATVVERLKHGGAIILGKTNMHEWALGGTTINPFYGTTRNPWDTSRIAGGSSGGSAAAVRAGLCLGSLGTDSAQSVRNPASMCGIVGLKPTYGRISQFGTVAGTGAFSTNHTGILTKTVEDCALVLQAVAGHDPKDTLSSDEPVSDYSKSTRADVKGLRIGILRGYFDEIVASEVRDAFAQALEVFRSLGMETEEVTIPHMDLIPAVKVRTSRVENAAAHAPYLRTRSRDYSRQTLFSYISGLLIPGTTYVVAQRVRRVICQEFDDLLARVQLLVVPTIPFTVPSVEECQQGSIEIDGTRHPRQDERGGLDSLCAIPFNVTGLPAISICCGFSQSGMPIGLQVAAGPFEEQLIFQVACAYEKSTEWHKAQLPLG